ncbi:flagellar basal body rod protein FlgB [Tissierella creatinophila]|uniref:Flagellar basal body rod protein FlgB n=1 Tax=Tissierella creatinophila DSM 6911 TaxID=1123403 RepID=A0A1U7M998_TISCR|nr:flagellar basal body rod protein FlgB [Tissierella creatinophila]OLS03778.1 flagellar basal body rod protein FlgB [Tissierella creatinophila DSM 6911]
MKDLSYNLIKKGLDMSSLRQRTISHNIANINTSNFKTGRVEFEEILKRVSDGVGIDKTDDKHFGVKDIDDIDLKVKKKNTTMLNDNGNNVDIDLEMTELSANEVYYNVLIRQVNSKLSSLNYVINS